MKRKEHRISAVAAGSIAEELELEAGDWLLAVNGESPEDIFDYQYLTEDVRVTLLIRKACGEEWELEIEKDADEDIGLSFENGLMDGYRSCANRCIFCFIDQMPPGMRSTLYFKDDDSRLSFLQGNYVTLTNMRPKDMDRIIRYRLSPINISVHTTNPRLREKMLGNRFAGKALSYLDRLYEAEITMNGQIVLCRGYNDGAELDRTLDDLSRYLPWMQSVSVVPVGLTRYREGLCPLIPYDRESSREVLETVHRFQERISARHGVRFVYASDEFYLMADEPLPDEERYDGYPQLENGVGMMRLFLEETRRAVRERKGRVKPPDKTRRISAATGYLAAPVLTALTGEIREAFPWIEGNVYPIENRFFGERITVSGLITGQDLLAQLSGKPLGECLLLPRNMLRSGESVFLDDMTVEELQRALGVPVVTVQADGEAFTDAVLGISHGEESPSRFRPYEPEKIRNRSKIDE